MSRLAINSLLLMCSVPSLLATQPAPPSWEAVDVALGRAGRTLPGEVRRYGWPRTDLAVSVDGLRLEPALALGSWAGFVAAGQGRAMVMGDLVLLASEVDPTTRAIQAGGLDVLAIHNHLAGEVPQVLYVHFGGHGDAGQLARALRGALEKTATPFVSTPSAHPSPSPAEQQAFDAIQEVLGRQGSLAGRVLQVGVPRASKIEEDGVEVPGSLGMSTALNFQAEGGRVATTGDFVLVADEVNPVVRELHAHGIRVTALHSHMLRESPRLFFMHFWAVGDPRTVADGLKAALSRVATR